MSSHRDFTIMGVMLGLVAMVALGLFATDSATRDTVRISDFPRTIGDWSSQDIPIAAQDLAILETNNAFVRRYFNPQGQEVFLYIVYSQNNRRVAHPPEICYAGSGVILLDKQQDTMTASNNLPITVNRLLLQSKGLYQITFYWFKVGPVFTSNYWKEQSLVAFNSLLGKSQSSALIRISANLNHQSNANQAIQEVKSFTHLITPQLLKYLP